eukprot:TRINITY_DN6781_c0_g1_i3.p1 TRINITY_DN6781_c0_g1~~TRINITY_DN6781_c0_g1_i3.p1  ORF type:complete len:784 (-),score=200.42 TRINITY_DN6781_c0_g1_i3:33-2336(-)
MSRTVVLLSFLALLPLLTVSVYPSGRTLWTSTLSHKYSSDVLKDSKVRVSASYNTWFLAVYQNRSELVRFSNSGVQTLVQQSEPSLNAKISSISTDGSVWYATQSSESQVSVRRLTNGNSATGPTWTVQGSIKSFSVETIGGDAVIAVSALGSLQATSSNGADNTYNPNARASDSSAYFLRLKSDGTSSTGSYNKGSCSNWIIGDVAVVPNNIGGNTVIVEGSVGFCTNPAGWQGASFTLRMINTVWLSSFTEGNAASAAAFLPFFSSTLLIEVTAPQPTTMQLRSFIGNQFLAYVGMREKYGFNVYAFFDTQLQNVAFRDQIGDKSSSFSNVRFGFSTGDDSTYTFASDLSKGWLLSLRVASGELGGSVDDLVVISSGSTPFVSLETVTRNETASSGVIGGSFEDGNLAVFGTPISGDSGTFVSGINVQLNFCPSTKPFECTDHRCVTNELQCWDLCDKTVCSDGSCSDSCPQDNVCASGKFLCPNGMCVPNGGTCQGSCQSGEIECFDGTCTNSGTCNGAPFQNPTLAYEATINVDASIDLNLKSAENASNLIGSVQIQSNTFNTTLTQVNSIVLSLAGATVSSFKGLADLDGSYVGVHSFLSPVFTVNYPKGFGTAFEDGSNVVISLQVTIPQNKENVTFCLAKQLDDQSWTCVDKEMYPVQKRDVLGDIYSGVVNDPQGTWGVLLLGGTAPKESTFTGIPGTNDSTDADSDNNMSKTTSFFKIGVGIAVGIAVLIIVVSIVAAFVLLKRKRANSASQMSNSLY